MEKVIKIVIKLQLRKPSVIKIFSLNNHLSKDEINFEQNDNLNLFTEYDYKVELSLHHLTVKATS